MKKKKLSNAIQTCIALIAVPTLLTQAAFAQEKNTSDELVEEIVVVTGSRIARPEVSQPAPIISIDSTSISRAATPDLASILAENAAIGATNTIVGNNDNNAFAGISSADLRRLGTERTLVLVDGKRHVAAAAGSAQVDLGSIPSALVERVEIITGGASAVYGSDAVSGVVNVLLKKNFEGFEFNASGSESTEDVGAQNFSFSLVAGAKLPDDRGNVTFYASRERIQQTVSNDLNQLDNFGSIVNPNDTGENDGIPDRLFVPRVLSEFLNANGVLNAPAASGVPLYTFDNAGNPVLQTLRDQSNNAAFGNFPDGCDFCFGSEDYEDILPGIKKINVGSTFNYELTDSINVFGGIKYVRSDIEQTFLPSFRFGNVNINVADNAFLPADLRQTYTNAGLTEVSFSKLFDELGPRAADNRRETFRFVGGFDGDFTISATDFNYELFYVNGRTNNSRTTLNDLIPSNFVAALDAVIDPATGQAACRSQVASLQGANYQDPALVNGDQCVPYNAFGNGQVSAAARDFVSANVVRSDQIDQEVIGGSLVFDTEQFLNLPGGPIGVALGFEYREERSESTTDEFAQRGFLTTAATPDVVGEFDVSEGFIELSLPILADLPFVNEFTVDLAYRNADYEPFGSVDASKVGVIYAPFETFRIRGTYGEAVRAPNINEAFSPLSPGFANIADPCDADNINDDPDRAANCAAIGIAPGFDASDAVSVNVLSGGNTELTPEESTSSTVGFVWTPNFSHDLSLTVDFYDIEIEDAIDAVTAQNIIDNCVDAAGSPDDAFCSLVERDATGNVDTVTSIFLNTAALTTQGIELQARYTLPMETVNLPGSLAMGLYVNHLLELERFEFQDRPEETNVEEGEVGDPEWQASFSADYLVNSVGVNWTLRYIDRSALFDVSPGADSPEDLSPAFVPSIITHDLSARYEFNDNVTFNIGVRNLFDKTPPGYTTNALYDLIGRRAFAGVNVIF